MPQLLLTRYEPYPASFTNITAWALRVTVEAVDDPDFDAKIFLHRRHPQNPSTGAEPAEFECVAGPYDYVNWPADEPSTERPFGFFRADWFLITLPHPDLADQVWSFVVAEADRLLRGLAALARMRPVDTAVVGVAGDSDSDSS